MKPDSIKITSERAGAFAVNKISLFLNSLPDSLHGYKFLQLTDLHYGPSTKFSMIQEALKISSQLNPHCLLLTGDFLQINLLTNKFTPSLRSWKEYKRIVYRSSKILGEELSKYKFKDGIIGVFGNHDHAEGINYIKKHFPKEIIWLQNHQTMILDDKFILELTGIDDLKKGKPDLKQFDTSLDLKNENDLLKFRILLSHNPDITLSKDKHLLDDYGLIVSGHSHGGQICFPFLGPIITSTKQRKHIRGLSYFNKTPIYVSSGVGYCHLPIRLFCPPEITLFELRNK